jgi:predicted RNase H-like HicB family nuclease
VRLEVVVEQTEAGEFQAKAVEYPDVSVTGRTEKEALVRLLDALELHLKRSGRETSR